MFTRDTYIYYILLIPFGTQKNFFLKGQIMGTIAWGTYDKLRRRFFERGRPSKRIKKVSGNIIYRNGSDSKVKKTPRKSCLVSMQAKSSNKP